jgi:hypothetical protein
VLVYGDTNSTLAGALAAAKVGARIAHVEAGLRSFDREMPEELNRLVVDRLSSLLLCPTELAARNLAAEAITDGVHVVGDVMLDANLRLAPLARARSHALADAEVESGGYLLITLHREANVEGPSLARIAAALNGLDEPVVFLGTREWPRRSPGRASRFGAVGPRRPSATWISPRRLLARLVLTDPGRAEEAYWTRPVRHAANVHRVGRDGRGRLEVLAGADASYTCSGDDRDPRASRRTSSATATPPRDGRRAETART